jgi:hypothetical protein
MIVNFMVEAPFVLFPAPSFETKTGTAQPGIAVTDSLLSRPNAKESVRSSVQIS